MWGSGLHTFLNLALETSGQLHFPVALSPDKESAIAIIQSAEWAPGPIRTLLEKRISYFLQESEDSFVVKHLA